MLESYYNLLFILGIISIFIILLSSTRQRKLKDSSNYRKIDLKTFKNLIENRKNLIILDVSTKEEFNIKNIPNSINIENYEVKQKIQTLVSDKSAPIVVYSSKGKSRATSLMLLFLGYKEVYDFGDIENWIEKS